MASLTTISVLVCWRSVADAGPTFNQYRCNDSLFVGLLHKEIGGLAVRLFPVQKVQLLYGIAMYSQKGRNCLFEE